MNFGMVAGEASGDLLAGLLLGGLKARWPQLKAQGIGGPQMAAHGFQAWWPHHKLAVHGYAEALRHYREISGIRKQLARRLLAERPDVFVGVDAPDFNLGLEARLKAAGIKTVHFVCPSIWAWRGGRAKKIARSADLVLCLFPFEPELLQRHGVRAAYVGHPLADAIPLRPPREAARAALNLADDARVVALLPGSRRGEITHIAPAFLAAAKLLHQRRPALRFVLPVVPAVAPLLRPLLAQHALDVPIQVVEGRSHEALAACDVTLIASGTATLEAALFKRPMVIAYKLAPLSWHIMKRMNYQPWVGLPNILSRDFVVPELLQHAATPEALADATLSWLDDADRCDALQRRFIELHQTLRCGTAERATEAISRLLDA
jgi:lipid-A-disaccharide synthase